MKSLNKIIVNTSFVFGNTFLCALTWSGRGYDHYIKKESDVRL